MPDLEREDIAAAINYAEQGIDHPVIACWIRDSLGKEAQAHREQPPSEGVEKSNTAS